PAQATPLIGREDEVVAVCDLLRQSTTRLLTLTGPGGIGKTRLALQAAAELLDDARDGVWFVPLAAIRDAALVAPAIGRVLEIADAGELPLIERLKRYLHQKQIMFVLDNFEQVAGAAALLAELLAAAPKLKILVTSREALHIYGEHEYAVPPLALPDLTRLPALARLSQYEAVRLFIERARAVKPAFAITDESAAAIAEICYRLDGLPLAIELAAARSRIFAPQALLARLAGAKHRLAFLTGGAHDLPRRQQTLRDAIAWSYDLLDVREQALFARLGVFAGGWTLAAAEAVCGDSVLADAISAEPGVDKALHELLDWARQAPPWQVALPTEEIAALVESLASKSLLKITEGEDVMRFIMLETMREYALERLAESGEEQAVGWRHAGYYGGLLCSVPGWQGAQELQPLRQELDNLRAALDWSVASDESLPGLAILGHTEFWLEHLNEILHWLDTLLAREMPASQALANAWYTRGGPLMYSGRYAEARLALDKHYRVIQQIDPASLLWQDWIYSWLDLGEGNLDEARTRFERFADIAQSQDDPDVWQTWAASGLAMYWIVVGEADIAYRHYEQALEGYRRVGNETAVADMLHKLGFAAQQRGNLVLAASHLRESLNLAQQRDTRRTAVAALAGFGGVALAAGNLDRAARLFGAVEALHERTTGFDPEQRILHQRNIAALRERLDPATLEARWAEGRALDW
ncbi:MAG TPA: NB-ARC domain-containing protein, partial [Roseiflexaceae bacterium]